MTTRDTLHVSVDELPVWLEDLRDAAEKTGLRWMPKL